MSCKDHEEARSRLISYGRVSLESTDAEVEEALRDVFRKLAPALQRFFDRYAT